MKNYHILIVLLLMTIAFGCNNNVTTDGNIGEKWSVKMAKSAIQRNPQLINYNNPGSIKWQYDIAMVGHAIDKLGQEDTVFSKYMEDFYDYFVQEDGSVLKYKMSDYNIDHINPAKGIITLYKRKGDEKYLKAIQQFVKHLEGHPKTSEGGYWHKKIYPYQMWLDGIYMASPFMAQYAQEFNQPAWFDTTAWQITLIYERTLDPETGLLYHAFDESREQRWANQETGHSPHFWGRAMGWYMMALVDVLDYFPQDHPSRQDIVDILNNVSEALLKVRDKDTGLWYQVLDKGGEPGNYVEGSCSAMFTYAFAKGARKGYLPEKYNKIARDSFKSMIDTFIIDNGDGLYTMTNICGAAGLGGNPYRDGSYEYYITEKRVDNDPKGVGPFILAAIEIEKE